MDIKYFGHASFFVKTKDSRLVTDPFDASIGIKFPKTEADIVTVSHEHADHNAYSQVSGNPLVLTMPGEFEKHGVRISGYASYHDNKKGAERGENTIYKIEAEDITILHCGDLGYVLEDSFIEQLGEIDILMVPTGGFYTINETEAAELVKKIEPSIVIPMHYNTPELNQQTFEKLSPVSAFLKLMGGEGIVPVPKLTVKKEELQQEMKVVVMSVSS